eukprot:3591688-Rhodomonas_salina.1
MKFSRNMNGCGALCNESSNTNYAGVLLDSPGEWKVSALPCSAATTLALPSPEQLSRMSARSRQLWNTFCSQQRYLEREIASDISSSVLLKTYHPTSRSQPTLQAQQKVEEAVSVEAS